MNDVLAELGLPLAPRSLIESPFVDRTTRFLITLMGGSSLLIPIIVVKSVDSQNMRLIIASIFVLEISFF